MKIFFDENFSPFLARGFATLQAGRNPDNIDVTCIQDSIGRGAQDEDIIPYISQDNGVLITQDSNIHRTRFLWELCMQYKIGLFFFRYSGKHPYTYWEWISVVLKSWEAIQHLSISTPKPFGYRFTPRKSKDPERLSS